MDPNASLAELRRWANAILEGKETDTERAAEVFEALDEWLSEAGFLPSEWSCP